MNKIKTYIVSPVGTFKVVRTTEYGHNNDIKNNNDNGTELLKYIWKPKYKKINYEMEWSIIHCVCKIKKLQ